MPKKTTPNKLLEDVESRDIHSFLWHALELSVKELKRIDKTKEKTFSARDMQQFIAHIVTLEKEQRIAGTYNEPPDREKKLTELDKWLKKVG